MSWEREVDNKLMGFRNRKYTLLKIIGIFALVAFFFFYLGSVYGS